MAAVVTDLTAGQAVRADWAALADFLESLFLFSQIAGLPERLRPLAAQDRPERPEVLEHRQRQATAVTAVAAELAATVAAVC